MHGQQFRDLPYSPIRQIRDSFQEAIEPQLLDPDQANSWYQLRSGRSIDRALRLKSDSPGLHFHLMRFMNLEVQSLPHRHKYFHFEAGPWPCLNPTCGT